MINTLTILWGIFGALFFGLGVLHLLLAFKKVSFLKIPDRFEGTGMTISVGGQDLDRPVRNLTEQLNKFLDKFNKSNKKSNIATAFGYFLASVTAFSSLYLSLI